MSVEIPDGAVDLAEGPHRGELVALPPQPPGHVRQLLAERRRARRLPVGARQHRQVGVRLRHLGQGVDQGVLRRQQHPGTRLRQHQGVGQVVDVLRRAGEVNELERALVGAGGGQTLADVIFDGFDVVIGRRLDRLHAAGVVLAEVVGQPPQAGEQGAVEGGELADGGVPAEGQEPLDFDPDPETDEAVFAEDRAEIGDARTVPAVRRRQGCESAEFHA